jgi:hypothetical protein
MLSWLASIGIGSIIRQLASAYEAKQNAITDQEKIAADERIKSLEARLEAKRAVQVAEAGSRINAFMRAFIAFGPAIYLFKLFAIDKVICPPLGLACRTDPVTPEQWEVVMAVVGFYFLFEATTTVARIIKRKA